ncbi:reverse transcriptase (RNA-dependent DNA polymerase) [Hirsutella rhossiliensis]
MTLPDGSFQILRLKKVAYCPSFSTSLISFQTLRDEGIYWDTFSEPTRLVRRNQTIGILQRRYQQFVLEFRPTAEAETVNFDTVFQATKPRRAGTKDLARPAKETATSGTPASLGLRNGVRIKGQRLKQISADPDRERNRPCHEIWIDWTDLSADHEDFVRVMFITDAFTGMVFPILCGPTKRSIIGLPIRLRSEGRTLRWGALYEEDHSMVTKEGHFSGKIGFKHPIPEWRGERSGGLSIERGRVMRIASRLPHNLWKEIVEAACYLRNRTPREPRVQINAGSDAPEPDAKPGAEEELEWKSPIELFTGKNAQLSHLRAYGCRAYAMTANAQLKRDKLRKLDPRAHIGYLVGYNSTNIFRIWIPYLKRVVSTRDVVFDEHTFFDGKLEQQSLLSGIEELIQKIEIPEDQRGNQEALDEETDEETDIEGLDAESTAGSTIVVMTQEEEDQSEEQEKEDYERARVLEEAGLLTPPTTADSEDEPGAVFSVHLPVATPEGVGGKAALREGVEKPHFPDNPTAAVFSALLCKAKEASDQTGIGQEDPFFDRSDRFSDFNPTPIQDGCRGAFTAGRLFRPQKKPTKVHKRDLPDPPETQKQLENHPYREEFAQAQQDHLASHEEMGSFEEISWKRVAGHQVLGCKWVFIYKTDKHGLLQKCKARLVVCGNQQKKGDLPTRATTLAGMSFRTLMAIAAEYDLELDQMDAVNAFVNCPLEEEEVVFMRMPPGFQKPGKVLRLRKALYGLRRSPLLWQQHLTGSLEELGFKKVPQEPCVMMKGAVTVFFYDSYIDKIAHKYVPESLGPSKLPDTPMVTNEELLPASSQANQREIHQYLQKVGSVLFSAISTRPDIAFAVSRLARHNQNPDESHQRAVDRVILYLYGTRSYGIRLGGSKKVELFLYNSLDRKSSQGYVMTLFGGTIAWKASKQATVTTSFRSLKGSNLLKPVVDVFTDSDPLPLLVECDNSQTIRLLEEGAKLSTRLRHVDIHQHWLRQECQEGRIRSRWLDQSSAKQKLFEFQRMIGLEDLTERLRLEARLEDLRDQIKDHRKPMPPGR